MTEQNHLTKHLRRLAVSATLALGSLGVISGVGGGSAAAIVGGNDTTTSENPWQVALTSPDGEQFCGGSIVSDRIIVTAAHCVQGAPESDVVIRAGVTDLSSSGGQTRNVAAIIEHPKFTDGIVGDIAVLVLDRPLELGADVAAIRLAASADIDGADTARVTGWGSTAETADDAPSVLQATEVPLVSDADCGLIVAGNDDELCAGGAGTDSCYGDSGGPLTVATDRGRVLAGVVSWGEECGGESAGVYTEVPTFAGWVAGWVADPDAPAGERLPAFDDEYEHDDFEESDDEFFEQFTDDELDAMTDDEFFDAYDTWIDVNANIGNDNDNDNDNADHDSTSSSGDLPTEAEIDAMTDAEFDAFINDLSDAEFDEFLDRYDVDVDDLGDDWSDDDWSDNEIHDDWADDDWSDNEIHDDWADDDWSDNEIHDDWSDNDWSDNEIHDDWADDDWSDNDWSDDDWSDNEVYDDWSEFDLNGDDIVQWSELAG